MDHGQPVESVLLYPSEGLVVSCQVRDFENGKTQIERVEENAIGRLVPAVYIL